MKRQPSLGGVSPFLWASSATALRSPHNLGMFRANKGSPSAGTGNAHFFINRLRKLCLRGMDDARSIPAHHPEDTELSKSLRGALSGVKASGHFLWLTAFRTTPARDFCSFPPPTPAGRRVSCGLTPGAREGRSDASHIRLCPSREGAALGFGTGSGHRRSFGRRPAWIPAPTSKDRGWVSPGELGRGSHCLIRDGRQTQLFHLFLSNAPRLTPTFRRRSPTMFSADIRAAGVSGVPLDPFSKPWLKKMLYLQSECSVTFSNIFFLN